MMKKVQGNTEGLKAWARDELLCLYSHRDTNNYVCDPQILETICRVSFACNREICLSLSGKGVVEDVSVGRFHSVTFASPKDDIRCIHTHPGGDGMLSETDRSAMAEPGMVLMAAVGVPDGHPGQMEICFREFDGSLASIHCDRLEDTDSIMNHIVSVQRKKEQVIRETGMQKERVVLIGVGENLDELRGLCISAGGLPCAELVQKKTHQPGHTYLSKGKIETLLHLVQIYEADTVLADTELSPGQQRRLENLLGVRVIDRTTLILDIFAKRARSREGKIQVELAQLSYLLPRLIGKGTILSRLGGGIGTRGPGETKLETDRRHIEHRIHKLKRELEKVGMRRNLSREKRKENQLFSFAVVGYTNAGKTTLINALSSSNLYAESLLFATLDPVSRGVTLPSGTPCILTDTVGFIRELPHDLVEAFRSTLEEITFTDCILHVIDASHPDVPFQVETVRNILREIGAEDMPTVEVLNKMDVEKLYRDIPPVSPGIRRLEVSALSGEGLDMLRMEMDRQASGNSVIIKVQVSYSKGELISFIHHHTRILSRIYESDGIHFTLQASRQNARHVLGSV